MTHTQFFCLCVLICVYKYIYNMLFFIPFLQIASVKIIIIIKAQKLKWQRKFLSNTLKRRLSSSRFGHITQLTKRSISALSETHQSSLYHSTEHLLLDSATMGTHTNVAPYSTQNSIHWFVCRNSKLVRCLNLEHHYIQR